jgi:hypothetical protein
MKQRLGNILYGLFGVGMAAVLAGLFYFQVAEYLTLALYGKETVATVADYSHERESLFGDRKLFVDHYRCTLLFDGVRRKYEALDRPAKNGDTLPIVYDSRKPEYGMLIIDREKGSFWQMVFGSPLKSLFGLCCALGALFALVGGLVAIYSGVVGRKL